MKQLALDILTQKRGALIVLAVILAADIALMVAYGTYVDPQVQSSYSTWSDLRKNASGPARADSATVYNQGRRDLDTLASRMSTRQQFPELLGSIQDLASACSVVVENFTYKQNPARERGPGVFDLKISVSGRYAEVKSFLDDIQGMDELAVVDSVTFTNSDMLADQVTMALSITLYLREGA